MGCNFRSQVWKTERAFSEVKLSSRHFLDSSEMRIVVSLSTVPSRVPYLQRIIDCLLSQTYQVDRIYINLPHWSKREQCEYPLPQLKGNDKIQIVRCNDHGPITKLYPALLEEQDPETLIITVDDDIEYIPERIETLVHWAEKFPEAAIGGTGFIVGPWWWFYGTVHRPKTPTPVSVLEGFSGCAYRRGFFSDDLIDYQDAPSGAFYNDDVWISGYLARKKIPRLVHPSSGEFLIDQKLPGALSASKIGVVRKILPVIAYFYNQNLFREEQVVTPWATAGFWVILLILILLIVILFMSLKYLSPKSGRNFSDLSSGPINIHS